MFCCVRKVSYVFLRKEKEWMSNVNLCSALFARFLMRSCERKKSPCQMSLKLYQNPKMTIEFDVEVVRKNNHLKRLFACRLKLHATSEFRKSWRAEPGVTRQITLSGFIPSAIFSVKRLHHSIVHSLLNHSILSTLYLLNWAWRVSKYWMLFG